MPLKSQIGGAMEQFDTRFKQLDVFPMVKHFMDQLDLFSLLNKYVPAAADSLAEHAEGLCILIASVYPETQDFDAAKFLGNFYFS
jgi:hypothetical protein